MKGKRMLASFAGKWTGKAGRHICSVISFTWWIVKLTSIDELKDTDRPFVQFKSDSNYYMEIQRWWQRHFAQKPGRQITVDQIETCKQLALNGIGYAILPSITLTGNEMVNKILF